MKCPFNECNGNGFLYKYDEERKEEVAYPCRCRLQRDEQKLFERRLISAYIPKDYWEYTFEGYKKFLTTSLLNTNEASISKIEKLVADPMLFILGEYAVLWIYGKDPNACHTSLAILLGKALLNRGVKVRFIRMQELVDVFTKFDAVSEFLEDLKSFSVYILDDAFDITRSLAKGEYTKIHLFNWLNTSISEGKKFICTSNVLIKNIDPAYEQCKNLFIRSFAQLEFVGDAVASRLNLVGERNAV